MAESPPPDPSDRSLSPEAGAADTPPSRESSGGPAERATPAAEPAIEPGATEPSASEPATEPGTSEPAAAAPSPGPSHAPSPTWRLWPDDRRARVLLVVLALLVAAYTVGLQTMRYAGMWHPLVSDGDQPQAVFQYWRYHIDGAFPPGDLLTDYAFVMHAPPVWWALMASMSTFIPPLFAAKILNVVAYALTCVMMWFAVSRRSNAFIGLAAVLALVRNWDFSFIIAGGYARSFGPFLTLAFLAAFMSGRHRLTLGILVLQAAFYPSVVIPCGLAYGIYTVVAGPMRDRLRRMAGMLVAGLLIIGFGKFQDIAAPEWWGKIVTLEEARQMPAWGPGGRVPELPLTPVARDIERHFERAFRPTGHMPSRTLWRTVLNHDVIFGVIFGAGAAGIAALWWRRRGRERLADPFPWQVPLLFVTAGAAYLLARALAFRLYVPYRPLQHVWPYMMYVGVPLLAWTLARNTFKRTATATLVTFVASTAPLYLVFGDGWERGPPTYASQRAGAGLYAWVRQQPVDAVFGGEFHFVDKIPLFAWHRSYVTKNLAHPFRKGYYAEAERRIVEMYSALYARKISEVVAFGQREKVDYLVVRDQTFERLDPRLFQPVRGKLAGVFARNKRLGFALERAPETSIVWRDDRFRVVSIAKLAEAFARGEVADEGPPPPPKAKPARPLKGLAPFGPLDRRRARPLEAPAATEDGPLDAPAAAEEAGDASEASEDPAEMLDGADSEAAGDGEATAP